MSSHTLPMTATPAGFAGWRVLAALSFVYFANMGFSQYGGAVLNAVTALGLHLDRRTLGYGAFSAAIWYGLAAPLAGWMVHRFGARVVIAMGSVLMGLGMLLDGTVVVAAWQFVAMAGLIGLGIGLSTQVPAQACTTAWFARRRALAVSLVWTAAGLGGYAAPPLLTRIIAHGTWRSGWLLVGALMLASGCVALFFVTNKPSDLGQFADGVDPALFAPASTLPVARKSRVFRSSIDWETRKALATPAFWIILFGALAQTAAIYVYLAHGVLHLMDLGHSRSAAAYSVSIFAIGAIAGKLLAGLLGDRWEPRFVWSFGALLMAYSMFGLVSASSNLEMYVPSVLLGMGNGIALVCWATLVANYFGPRAFPALMGAQVPFVSILGALAPLAAGSVFENHHTYTPVFYTLACFSAAAAIVLFVAAPPAVRVEEVHVEGATIGSGA